MPKSESRKKLIKKLRNFGFEGPYAGSKHMFMIKNDLRLRIPNPHAHDISTPLVLELLRQAGISRKEWDRI